MTDKFIPPVTQFPNYGQQIADRLNGHDAALREVTDWAKEVNVQLKELLNLHAAQATLIEGLQKEVSALKARP